MDNKIKRIEWIDALKGYAIICVTLGHLGCNFLIEKHIYSFHMFVFFFLSGVVDKSDSLPTTTYVIKKIKSILVPFICWNILSGLVSLYRGKEILYILKTMLILNGEVCWNAPIWFLLTIFITQVLCTLLRKHLHINDIVLLLVSLICWLIIPQKNIIFKLNLIPMSLFFYLLGIVLKDVLKKEWQIQQRTLCVIGILSLLFVTNIVFGVIYNVRIVYTKAIFGNILHCISAGLSGTLFYTFLFKMAKFLNTNKLLIYLGNKSLIIMTSQFYLFTFYDSLFYKGFYLQRNTLKAAIVTMITISIICTVSEIINHLGKKNKILKSIDQSFGI